jgi:hypothetical protein
MLGSIPTFVKRGDRTRSKVGNRDAHAFREREIDCLAERRRTADFVGAKAESPEPGNDIAIVARFHGRHRFGSCDRVSHGFGNRARLGCCSVFVTSLPRLARSLPLFVHETGAEGLLGRAACASAAT